MLTVVLHNGICNRLLPLISTIRLARKSNRKTNIVWTYTPVRSCIAYHGDLCKYEDLFIKSNDILMELSSDINNKIYEFRYWENKDHVIDISGNDNIFVNYALYTIISTDDDQSTIFKNFKSIIDKPQEIIKDDIAKEFRDILKNDIVPVNELQKEIDHLYKSFYKNMVGIHIRKSDGGFANYNWKEMTKILIKQSKEWCKEDNNNGIFLATDDMDIYIEFASVLGNKMIFYNPPEILCNTKSTSGNKFSNDKYNALTAVVELNLLGKCNKYIIGTADSTFSVCGMLLSEDETRCFLINDINNIPKFN